MECVSVDAAVRVRESPAFEALKSLLAENASYVHFISAKDAKRINDVDRTWNGLFLSLRQFALAKFTANDVVAMPILYYFA